MITPLLPAHARGVEDLLDRAFGTDRHARTAYRVRGGREAIPALSFVAIDADALVGSIQCWPVALYPDAGNPVPLIMVGPIAVDPARQRGGLGRALTTTALDAAVATGDADALCLIGDPEYYDRFFGFSGERTSLWRLPGPVERHRLLARGPAVPDVPGLLGPR